MRRPCSPFASDPEVMRYFSEPWEEAGRAAEVAEQRRFREEFFRFAVELKATGEYLGSCSLFSEHRQNRRAEIGYALGRPYWGRGYMHEALSALLEFAFIERDLNRLEADIDPLNAGSASALERQGFGRKALPNAGSSVATSAIRPCTACCGASGKRGARAPRERARQRLSVQRWLTMPCRRITCALSRTGRKACAANRYCCTVWKACASAAKRL
jgi:hypothetical protein